MKRKLLCAMLALCAFIFVACAGFQVKQMAEGMADAQVKIMEAQAKIDKEKRQERYSIEGEVKTIEMREKDIPDPDPEKVKTEQEPTEKGVKIKVVQPPKKIKYCVVVFSDGREKEFQSVPNSPLNAGTYYKIEYNGMNEVVSVTKIK